MKPPLDEDRGLTARARQRLDEAFATERLAGLYLAMLTRSAALIAIGFFLIFVTRPPWLYLYQGGLLLIILNGIAHYQVQKTRPGALWVGYLFVTGDVLLTAIVIFGPTLVIPAAVPPQMYLRTGAAIYFLVLVALTALKYTPGLTLWAGLLSALCWLGGAFLYAGLPGSLTSLSVEPGMAADAYLAVTLDPRFVDLDLALQDAVVILVVTAILATANWRARRLVARQTAAERERSNLARYFPPRLVDRLSQSDDPLSSVRAQDIAVLFADIVGFTHMAEHAAPGEIIALLREFHRRLEKVVFEHNGTLDKFLGDGVMATFGTPDRGPRDALNALAAGRAMLAEMESWNQSRQAAGEPPVKLSVGIHYGPVVLGDIGSERRLEFAVVGDTVNTASRLEHLTRELGCRLIASEPLVAACRRESGTEAASLCLGLRDAPPQAIRGRDDRVAIRLL